MQLSRVPYGEYAAMCYLHSLLDWLFPSARPSENKAGEDFQRLSEAWDSFRSFTCCEQVLLPCSWSRAARCLEGIA